MSDEAIDLAFAAGLPFVGLRDHEHDPELDRIIPLDAARFARAIPLVADDDRVRLAVAEPQPDLEALTPYLEGRRVELAIAPREEVETILGPAPATAAGHTTWEPSDAGGGTGGIEEGAGQVASSDLAAPATEPAAPPDVGDGTGIEEGATAESEQDASPDAAAPEPKQAGSPDVGDGTSIEEGATPESERAASPEPAASPPEQAASPDVAAAEPEQDASPDGAAAEPEHAAPSDAAAAEPEQAVSPSAAAPDSASGAIGGAGEAPSWLEPPRERSWLRAVGRFLLYVLVLAIICAAVAAYLLTR